MAKLYQKIILQHYRQPLNRGRLKNPRQTFRGSNYFCGDKLTVYVKLDKQKKIKQVAWQGGGCAISQAAASIFSEMIKGKSLTAVKKIKAEKILQKIKMPLSPTRAKCALLPLYTLKEQEITFNEKN